MQQKLKLQRSSEELQQLREAIDHHRTDDHRATVLELRDTVAQLMEEKELLLLQVLAQSFETQQKLHQKAANRNQSSLVDKFYFLFTI